MSGDESLDRLAIQLFGNYDTLKGMPLLRDAVEQYLLDRFKLWMGFAWGDLSVRTRRLLRTNTIVTKADLMSLTDERLAAIFAKYPKALSECKTYRIAINDWGME